MSNREQHHYPKDQIQENLIQAVGFDTDDFAASATSMYLLYSEEIVSAREEFADRLVSNWKTPGGDTQYPSHEELLSAVAKITAQAAYETERLIPPQREEIDRFWGDIGTALYGAEVEIFKNGTKTDSLPFTTDNLIHKARRDSDRFITLYNNRLNRLEVNEGENLLEENVPRDLSYAAD